MSDIEAQLAVLKQRSDDQQEAIRTFGPLVTQHAVLGERLDGLQAGLNEERRRIRRVEDELETTRGKVDEEFAKRDQRATAGEVQRRKDKIALYLALAGLFLTFGGLVIAVLTLLGHTT